MGENKNGRLSYPSFYVVWLLFPSVTQTRGPPGRLSPAVKPAGNPAQGSADGSADEVYRSAEVPAREACHTRLATQDGAETEAKKADKQKKINE